MGLAEFNPTRWRNGANKTRPRPTLATTISVCVYVSLSLSLSHSRLFGLSGLIRLSTHTPSRQRLQWCDAREPLANSNPLFCPLLAALDPMPSISLAKISLISAHPSAYVCASVTPNSVHSLDVNQMFCCCTIHRPIK